MINWKNLSISATFLLSSFSYADTNNVEFDLIGSYAQTSNPITVDTKTFSFKTGAVGLRASLGDDDNGRFHLQYGVAYSPSENASFHDAKLSGSISVQSYGYGYTYPIKINNSPISFDLNINNVTNKHTGSSFTGTHNLNNVNATVNATSDFMRAGLGMNYEFDKDHDITIGFGRLNWTIDASANGKRTDQNITFATDINANGDDDYYYVESSLRIMNEPVKVGYRRSNLTTDVSNTLNEVYFQTPVNWF